MSSLEYGHNLDLQVISDQLKSKPSYAYDGLTDAPEVLDLGQGNRHA